MAVHRPAHRMVSEAIAQLRTALGQVERRATADRVRRAEAETVLAHLRELDLPILIANNNARYIDANEAATSLTGYSREELLQMSVWDLTPVPDQVAGRQSWKAFLEAGEMSGSYAIRRKDGSIEATAYYAAADVLPGLHVSALIAARERD